MDRTAVKTEVDGHRLIFHPRRVVDWLENRTVYPIYMELGLTNRCNHRCVFCGLDWVERGRVEIDGGVLESAIRDLARCGVKSVMFAGEGEPLLHPSACEFIRFAKESGLDVSLNTNGALLTEAIARRCLPFLSWIRISLDADTAGTYSTAHGVRESEFEKTLGNIRAAARIKRENNLDVTIGVQTLVIPPNLEELSETVRVVRATGADNIQIKPYSHNPYSSSDLFVDPERLAAMETELLSYATETFQVQYRRNTAGRIREGKTYAECHGLPFFALTDARGNVIPCHLFYNQPEFCYGNLYERPFSAIWEGAQRKEVLDRLRKRGVAGCIGGCRLDVVNRYLHELKHPHPHVNFI